MRRKCLRNASSEPKPAPSATRSSAALPLSSASLATATRSRSSHSYGAMPVESLNARSSVRGLIAARSAMRGTVWCSFSRPRTHCINAETRLASGETSGRGTNCACPPSRCGGITRRCATALATRGPWSERTRCSIMSSPAAEPAEVTIPPSSTSDTSGRTSTAGKRAASAGAKRQCVVALRPSSRPAAARTNAPPQIEHRRAPRAWAARRAFSIAGGGASSMSRQPGTMMVCAARATPGRGGRDRDAARRAHRSGLQGAGRESYQSTPSSARRTAKISTTQANSNVDRRS